MTTPTATEPTQTEPPTPDPWWKSKAAMIAGAAGLAVIGAGVVVVATSSSSEDVDTLEVPVAEAPAQLSAADKAEAEALAAVERYNAFVETAERNPDVGWSGITLTGADEVATGDEAEFVRNWIWTFKKNGYKRVEAKQSELVDTSVAKDLKSATVVECSWSKRSEIEDRNGKIPDEGFEPVAESTFTVTKAGGTWKVSAIESDFEAERCA